MPSVQDDKACLIRGMLHDALVQQIVEHCMVCIHFHFSMSLVLCSCCVLQVGIVYAQN